MSIHRLETALTTALDDLASSGRTKGTESVITDVLPAVGDHGPRVRLVDEGDRAFLRMNSNGYLGLSRHPAVIAAADAAIRRYGAGPEAVRFISGTYAPHTDLERRLAAFHGRDAAMIFSSAYAAVMGVISPLITDTTAVISDQLNHNSIINAIRLSRPLSRHIYAHGEVTELRAALAEAAANNAHRVVVVTDGVFSMRGDIPPLADIRALADEYGGRFSEGVVVVVDDSHGVGALGAHGRGVEEVTATRADLLIATLGKAFGVNGGYITGSATVIRYLRETSPFYIYSNPITPGEAAAAKAAIDVVDSPDGMRMLEHLRAMTLRFQQGLILQGYETIPGEHPVVPLLIRDTTGVQQLVEHLRASGVLATGLGYPVVPRGDEEIRFQLSADHTEADVDQVLAALADFHDA